MFKLKEAFFRFFFSCFRHIRYLACYFNFLTFVVTPGVVSTGPSLIKVLCTFHPYIYYTLFCLFGISPWWQESGFPQSVSQTVPTLTTLLLRLANNAVTHEGRRPTFQILRKFFVYAEEFQNAWVM